MNATQCKNFTLALAISGLLAACARDASQQEMNKASEGYIVADTNKLLVVDCLLPGQLRKLGGEMTYLTARRPIRTTAADCEVRGGEYVAYDRANYASALNIWLPKAQEGDVAAQLYVGEIFEKGLGTQADYQAARQWYEKAATQGSLQAQLNLGHLYEKGLGVAQDKEAALRWYRKSAGLDQTDIPFTPAVDAKEIEALRSEVAESRQEAETMRSQMDSIRQQAQTQQERLREAQSELKALRKKLKQQQSAPSNSSDTQSLELELREKQAQVKEQQTKLDALTQTLSQERQQSRQNLSSQANKSHQETEQLRAQMDDMRQQALAQQDDLHTAKNELDTLRKQLQQQKLAASHSGSDNESLAQKLTEKESQIKEQQAKLDTLSQTLSQERQQVKQNADSQTAKSRQETEQFRAQMDAARQQATTQQASLAKAQAELESLRKQMQQQKLATSQATTVDALERQLREKEAQINEKQAKLDALNQALSQEKRSRQTLDNQFTQSRQETEQLRAQIEKIRQQTAAQQDSLSKAQAELETLRGQAQQLKAAAARPGETEAMERQLRDKETQIKEQQAKLDVLTQTLNRERQRNTLLVSGNGPNIELLKPAVTITRGIPVIQFNNGESSKRLVGRVDTLKGLSQLMVNNQSIAFDKDGRFETDVTLQGDETVVQIVATNKQRQSSNLNLRLLAADNELQEAFPGGGDQEIKRPSDIQFGKFYALIIGNNDYSAYAPLKTPTADAKSVEMVLRERYGFTTKLLINANRHSIMSAFNELNQKLTEQDNLLIYYAGHGEIDKKSRVAYWLPVDAEVGNTANWISSQSVTELLSIMPARHIMVVADSCYSGALAGSAVAKLPEGMDEAKRERWLKAMNSRKARTVLTSGGVKPVMDQGGGDHSVFANAFLKVLRGNRRIIEDYDIFRNVVNQVRASASRGGFEQTPQYAPLQHAGHEGSPFFFVPEA